VRSRGGGVLSASALVALGTSVLLVALVGLGLSELASPPGSGASGTARREAAAVVVPDLTVQRHVAAGKHRQPATSPRPSIPVLTPSVGGTASPATTARGGSTAAATVQPTVRATATTVRSTRPKVTSPTPSPTRSQGKGKGKGSGHGNTGPHGHGKPPKP